VPTPPAATVGPSVSGSARRGQALVVQPGTWSNGPSGYAYQWQRLVNGWENIDGATNRSYVPNGDDLGRRLRALVIASNDDGSASAGSAPTSPIGGNGLGRAGSATSRKGAKHKATRSKKTKSKKTRAKSRRKTSKKSKKTKKKSTRTTFK
jgi:hypothetical protein